MGGKTNLGKATPLNETDKALLVLLDADDEEYWVPKSVIDDDSECYSMESGAGDLVVATWWAEREDLTR